MTDGVLIHTEESVRVYFYENRVDQKYEFQERYFDEKGTEKWRKILDSKKKSEIRKRMASA